jgi:hypothetical protein
VLAPSSERRPGDRALRSTARCSLAAAGCVRGYSRLYGYSTVRNAHPWPPRRAAGLPLRRRRSLRLAVSARRLTTRRPRLHESSRSHSVLGAHTLYMYGTVYGLMPGVRVIFAFCICLSFSYYAQYCEPTVPQFLRVFSTSQAARTSRVECPDWY